VGVSVFRHDPRATSGNDIGSKFRLVEKHSGLSGKICHIAIGNDFSTRVKGKRQIRRKRIGSEAAAGRHFEGAEIEAIDCVGCLEQIEHTLVATIDVSSALWRNSPATPKP
jgi:hypothetical protein